MTKAKKGDQVKVHYTGTLSDGSVFDSSTGREPLSFTLGGGQMIPGFDEAVHGMEVGEEKTVTLAPEKAYGPRYKELVMDIPLNQVPDDIDPEVGQRLQLVNENNEEVVAVITEVSDTTMTLDANPPLAGQHLTFTLELVEIG